MLGKLLKHELQATSRTMLPLFGLLLLVSALTNLAMRGLNGSRELPPIVSVICVILLILFMVGVMTVGIVTLWMMVQRFRRNLLRDEGYIMHTLPVSIHAQIWAKVIVSGLWYALSAAALVLSVLLMAADVEFVRDMGKIFGGLFHAVMGNVRNVEILLELLGVMVLAGIFLSLMLYASLAVGHAFSKRKMGLSECIFVAFIVLFNVLTSVSSELLRTLDIFPIAQDTFIIGAWRATMGLAAGHLVVYAAILYAVTAWFMKHRLNLD